MTETAEPIVKTRATRAPLTLTVGEQSLVVAKYPFPTKFTPITIVINGDACEAGLTTGKDSPYTYFYVGDTALYVKGHLADGDEGTIEFPENYKWDEARKARVSTYKRKTPVEAATEGQTTEDGATVDAGEGQTVDGCDVSPGAEGGPEEVPAPKAKRRR